MNKAIHTILSAILIVVAIPLTLTSAYATNVTVDIGTDAANSNLWQWTDGTNSLNSQVTYGSMSVARSQGLDVWVNGSSTGYTLNQNITQSTYTGFSEATLNFNVSGLVPNTNVYINIASFGVDDRAALEINGVLIDLTGIINDNNNKQGVFQFAPGGKYVQETFNGVRAYPDNSSLNAVFSSSLLHDGINTVELIVNNTDNGISGNTIVNRGGDSTNVALDASITYDPIPEPTSITLLIMGLLGFCASRKKHC